MITIRFLCIAFLLKHILACAPLLEPQTLIFNYDDFGPQALAQEFLKGSWWRWSESGASTADAEDVQIIVYAGQPLASVKEQYPIDEAKGRDYRYVRYRDAIEYLDSKIEEDLIPSLTDELKDIRSELIAVFE